MLATSRAKIIAKALPVHGGNTRGNSGGYSGGSSGDYSGGNSVCISRSTAMNAVSVCLL